MCIISHLIKTEYCLEEKKMVDPIIYFLQAFRGFSCSFFWQGVLILYRINFYFLAKPLLDTHMLSIQRNYELCCCLLTRLIVVEKTLDYIELPGYSTVLRLRFLSVSYSFCLECPSPPDDAIETLFRRLLLPLVPSPKLIHPLGTAVSSTALQSKWPGFSSLLFHLLAIYKILQLPKPQLSHL